MIGAYFSDSGQTIHTGAAGLGEYFDAAQGAAPPPAVTSFQDGVFGGGSADVYTSVVGDDPGPLMAYRDGSLGACAGCGLGEYEQAAAGLGYPLFVDGKPVDRPVSIMHAPSPMGLAEGPLMAFRDGSLGEYFSGQDPRVRAYRSGILGAFGAGGSPKIVDMTNPGVLKEVKTAVAMFVPEVAMVHESVNPAPNVGPKYYDAAFYESPIWDEKAQELWAAAVEKLTKLMKLPAEEVSQTSKGSSYPTPAGLSAVIAGGAGAPVGDPKAFPSNFPSLYGFQTEVVAAKGDLKDFKVLPPFFTTEEKVKGKSTFAGMSTGMIVGIGAVAAIGAFLLLRKKRP